MSRLISAISRSAHPTTDRRGFLRRAAVGAAGTFAAPAFLRGRDLNSRLNVAVIGTGGRGAANLEGVSSENRRPVRCL